MNGRRFLRRGYGPLVFGALLYLLAVGVWRSFVTPALPATLRRSVAEDESTYVPLNAPGGPFFSSEDPFTARLLFVGDSRAGHAIDVEAFRELGRTAVLWSLAAQLTETLEAARELPARRLVVALSPLSLYSERNPRLDEILAKERDETLSARRIDEELGAWFRSQRKEMVRGIGTRNWARSWFYQVDTDRSTEGYKKRLRPETRPQRDENVERGAQLLRELVRDGWEIVCIRLPVSSQLLAVEEEAIAAQRFVELCESAEVPFLDYSRAPFQTHDGSHLIDEEAQRFSQELARRIAKMTNWSL